MSQQLTQNSPTTTQDTQFKNKHLVCVDCNQDFIFSGTEQAFFKEQGLKEEPKRCAPCRRRKRDERDNRPSRERTPLVEYEAVCSRCANETTIPFEPKDDRPVYCRTCMKRRTEQSRS